MAGLSELKQKIDRMTPEQREDLLVTLLDLCARGSLRTADQGATTNGEAKVREEEPEKPGQQGTVAQADGGALPHLVPGELIRAVFALSEKEKLDLIRNLSDSQGIQARVADGIRRIEEVAKGEVVPLSEEQFRAALE